MPANSKSIRPYRTAVGIGWVLLAAAAAVYARLLKIPVAIALPLALAFLVEYPFYLLPGFAAARDRFVAKGKPRAAAFLAASAIFPWLIYALSTGHFNRPALVVLTSIAVLMCFWYIALPAHPATDLAYLSLFAAIVLLKVFARVYRAPLPKLEMSVLGHVMLIRVMAFSIVAIRGGSVPGNAGADYRFMPTPREWLAGLRWFAFLLPVTGAAYWALGLVELRPHPLNIALVIGTFFGILWVTAISEEFIFRGLLQPWFEKWTSSPIAALVITSLLFGSIHLSFRFHGSFPNWRFSIVAAILGLFCGMARRQTGGIQAGMVAHALTVAVWKMFLR
jgi:membrane protease YdiL (CAAX protease family)